MSNLFETLEGELHYVRTKEAEQSPFTPAGQPPKFQWKLMFRPNQESLMKVMDMQSKGVKNQLKKDEQGYYVNFSRPTEIRTKKGVIKLDPPKVTNADGSVIDELIGNGSKGTIRVELYQHNTPNGGKAYAARLDSITVTDLIPYGDAQPKVEGWN